MRHESGIELAVMLPNVDNQPNFLHEQYGGKGIVFSFEAVDAQKEYERSKEHDVEIIFDLKDEEWGQRHCMIKDPSGIIIDIVQQL
jgi:uncharacterized glyoxalase superfamily protein PhnB